jgi:hypothetical protein
VINESVANRRRWRAERRVAAERVAALLAREQVVQVAAHRLTLRKP